MSGSRGPAASAPVPPTLPRIGQVRLCDIAQRVRIVTANRPPVGRAHGQPDDWPSDPPSPAPFGRSPRAVRPAPYNGGERPAMGASSAAGSARPARKGGVMSLAHNLNAVLFDGFILGQRTQIS